MEIVTNMIPSSSYDPTAKFVIRCFTAAALFFAVASAVFAEQFEWSFEEEQPVETGEPKEQVPADLPAAAPPAQVESRREAGSATENSFGWTWGDGQGGKRAEESGKGEAAAEKGLDVGAYDELLKENLELRKRITDIEKEKDSTREQNEGLSRQVQELEVTIKDLMVRIQEVRDRKLPPRVELQALAELEELLMAAEQEKDDLGKHLGELEKAALKGGRKVDLAELERLARQKPQDRAIQPGSDLFKKLQEESIVLKRKLVMLQEETHKAAQARDEIHVKYDVTERELEKAEQDKEALKEALTKLQASEKEHEDVIGKLLQEIPRLENELKDLQANVKEKEMILEEKDKDVVTLQTELERREHRLAKAERMAALLESAREDIMQVSDKEKRDMHYNMAVVYAKEGNFKAAEKEYLCALRLDPVDPSVHYNLGILYDDELNDKERAAMHYRKYLKLAPHAADVDTVKDWLMKLELNE